MPLQRCCLCTTCKGALVSHRTLIRHRNRPKINEDEDKMSTSEQSSSGGENSSEDSSEDSESSDGSENPALLSQERPLKKARIGSYDNTDTPAKGARNETSQDIPPNDDENESTSGRHDKEFHEEESSESDLDSELRPNGALFAEEDREQIIAQEVEMAQNFAAMNLDDVQERRAQEDEEREAIEQSRIENVRIVQQYTELIACATIENTKLDEATRDRLDNPLEEPPDITDPDIRLSLDLFIACNNASEKTYNSVRESILRRFPTAEVYTYKQVKRLVADISGVVSVVDDMCINSCHAFTGPFADLQACHICGEPRYDPKILASTGREVPRKQACTIPLGPQIQALRRSRQSASAMRYRQHKTEEILASLNAAHDSDTIYDDIFSGADFLDLHKRLDLSADDTTVMFSLDGAQLYQNKKSDTWIAIWIIADYDPKTRYKKRHILPALIVPGPSKPKILDSFLFQSFHHLSAIQRANNGAGLRVWDQLKGEIIFSRTINLLELADAVALAELDGRVGHHGAQGCRIGCDMKGRHKPSSGHYFAVHLRPNGANAADCNHPDFNFRMPQGIQRDSVQLYNEKIAKIIGSTDQADYERNRKATGLSKPSLISGLRPQFTLSVPGCFTIDLMHLLCINLGELLIPLWRGSLKCETTDDKATWDWAVLTDETWQEHGGLVASATKYFPSSFHRAPRNPAEKISSGYKATEYFLYVFGLGPALFRKVLPGKYWKNFCKLVHGVRIIIQRQIKKSQLREAYSYLIQFVEEYENIYYQRRMDRLHFCRPSFHTLLHTAPEVFRMGPGAYCTQYTMERSIGDMGQDIRQPSNPFANLCQIALRQSQLNALKSMCPELDNDISDPLPKYAYDNGNGYIFLTPRQQRPAKLYGEERFTIEHDIGMTTVRKWGRLRLPNSQVARSVFSEQKRQSPNIRITRNVKIQRGDGAHHEFAEVQFYFLCVDPEDDEKFTGYALVSLYGPPDADMLEQSCHTLVACPYLGLNNLVVIPISKIVSVISMQPLPRCDGDPDNLWFVVEKSGLDDTELTGYVADMIDEQNV